MMVKLFTKNYEACYSTSKFDRGRYSGLTILSEREMKLLTRGWVYRGRLYGRDITSGGKIPTMTKVLTKEKK